MSLFAHQGPNSSSAPLGHSSLATGLTSSDGAFMKFPIHLVPIICATASLLSAQDIPWAQDPAQVLERSCFQTSAPWSEAGNLRSDVAIVYGIGADLPDRIKTWREHGYRIHVMTGVSWGHYQDYLYGKFDGANHEDEAQTVSDGRKSSHGGDVYYMCPTISYGKFLCVGIQRALDAGSEAIHLEEPEFWVNSGYSEAFKREWQDYYHEAWHAPHSSVNAQWRASKLKYFLYRRALQQVFDYVSEFNTRTGKHVRCYVPTHSLINYASWEIVSPESSLAQLKGCDGYIAQVWTGTARTPNVYQGKTKERTFETAFLEYGAMQNLVRSTGRTVWYLNDPIEDNPNHDWNDYKYNWEATLTASLLQPDVSQFEVAPWPERIFKGHYPKSAPREERKSIPPAYATELQIVMNALNDMKQTRVEWDAGTTGIGVVVSDSLMFQRGAPKPSDKHLSHFYGLALPLLKHGIPVAPVQLENVTVPHYLDTTKVLLLTYQGQKPLSEAVHDSLAAWVKQGGSLVVIDDDSDPFNTVQDWWNQAGKTFATPRAHLFTKLGYDEAKGETTWTYGSGRVQWLRQNPVTLSASIDGANQVISITRAAAEQAKLTWRETNSLLLRRGPYIIAAGLDESIYAPLKTWNGRCINLFDPDLKLQDSISLTPGSRYFLREITGDPPAEPQLLAAACKVLPQTSEANTKAFAIEGVGQTPGLILLRLAKAPKEITLDNLPLTTTEFDEKSGMLWLRFPNEARPRTLRMKW